jgi:hypothetical protein
MVTWATLGGGVDTFSRAAASNARGALAKDLFTRLPALLTITSNLLLSVPQQGAFHFALLFAPDTLPQTAHSRNDGQGMRSTGARVAHALTRS